MEAARRSLAGARARPQDRHHVGRAKETLEVGRQLQQLPSTADAARQGQLSAEQASAIADAASADPLAERQLLDTAESESLTELRAECARTKANSTDREERRRRIHERRRLRTWTDADGAGHLHLRDNPEIVADVMARVAPVRDELAEKARAEGPAEPLDAHAVDALHQLVCADQANATKPAARRDTKILVRVDLDALLRGAPIGDEVCEIAGYGPVAVSVVREMLETGDPFLAAIATRGKSLASVAHLGRRPTAHQRSALEWLYPTCAAEGCNSLTFLEIDHREDWAKTRVTLFDLLDRLCRHHHRLKTTDGWALIEGRGKRAFVAPDDPRHPRGHGRHPVRPAAA